MSKAFSRPRRSISRQKYRIWMRMCRVMPLFVVFEGFGKLRTLAPLDSWILVLGEAALAADLITA